MLGKTNLTAVEGGTIVSDIEDYGWTDARISGITSSFQKVIYANNILVGITKDGMIAFTKDGENWETKNIEMEDGIAIEFYDIDFGHEKFVIVGSCTDGETYIHGLMVITENLVDYKIVVQDDNKTGNVLDKTKFVSIKSVESGFCICYIMSVYNNYSPYNNDIDVYFKITNLEETTFFFSGAFCNTQASGTASTREISNKMNEYSFRTAKKSDGTIIFCIRHGSFNYVYLIENEKHLIELHKDSTETDLFTPFECKDTLYINSKTDDFNLNLYKIGLGEMLVVTTGIEWGFIDAVYFNKCECFINSHEMLVVKPGENIKDKALQDLIEITYDFSMTTIKKAFDKLYVFGTGGNILVSSDEIKNEESIAVKTMSALKALYDAKAYADGRYAELEARITKMEERLNSNQQN